MTIQPFNPALDIPDDYPELLPEVQRQLGRCVLLSQRVEQIVKVLLALSTWSITAEDLERDPSEIIKRSLKNLEKSSLGVNVGLLFEQFLLLDQEQTPYSVKVPDAELLSFARSRFFLRDAEYQSLKHELEAVVQLRNSAVHHLREQFDLDAIEGRRLAIVFLSDVLCKLLRVEDQLRSIAIRFDKFRKHMAEVMLSDVIRNLVVHGINVDGTIDWSRASIGESLENAFKANAQQDWCDLDKAATWILEREPEQNPGRFACQSWEDVLHNSAFEFQRRRGGRVEFRPGRRREKLLRTSRPIELSVVIEQQVAAS